MMFCVESDHGSSVSGYIVPDGNSSSPAFVVLSGQEEVFRGRTNLVRPDIIAFGRHETGRIGFSFSEEDVPGLSEMVDLAIYDADSGIRIYRRFAPGEMIHKKVLRLETHLLPARAIDRALERRFQYHFTNADRFGMETLLQTFHLATGSLFVGGRVNYRSTEHFTAESYDKVILLHDPFEELAERLMFLRLAGERKAAVLGPRDEMTFSETIKFAMEADLRTEKSIKSCFRDMPQEVGMILANPLLRQLTTVQQEETLDSNSVRTALTLLSEFAVVGIRNRPDVFAEALGDLVSIDPGEIPVPTPIPAVRVLAERFRGCRVVEDMLEHDLSLYQIVTDAFEKSLIESYS